MALTLLASSGHLKKFRGTPWSVQRTFPIPLTNLRPFVDAICSSLHPFEDGTAVIDEVVFGARKLIALLSEDSAINWKSENTRSMRDWSLITNKFEELQELLFAALQDQIDFIFIPNPRRFVFYADHDEFVTFFSIKKGQLDLLGQKLTSQGVRMINNYQRKI